MFHQIKNVYFIGIGGIGMSALARWFLSQGCQVAGYDRSSTLLTQTLETEGVAIHYTDNLDLIPKDFIGGEELKEQNLIIYTPAVPANHSEFNYFQKKGYPLKKRAEVLGMIAKNFFTVAVAGTHGKTTTSSMIAHILHESGRACTAFLGGILQNYHSNLILSKKSAKETIMVVEADEYDRSFLHLEPDLAIITYIDADHLDIYGDKAQLQIAFEQFVKKIRKNGRLLIKKDLDLRLSDITSSLILENYALKTGDFSTENIRIMQDKFYFDFVGKGEKIENIELQIPGFHNVENALAAIAVARNLGLSPEEIKAALASYKGVKRRFEYLIRDENKVFIDDYAHHPTEIEAFLKSVKALYPDKKITAIFQPHLYSRTRDFLEGFAESLSLADEVILLEIYPARELPIEGVSSKLILDKISIQNKRFCTKENLLRELQKIDLEVVLTIGAGDIDQMIEKIKTLILSK